MALRGKGCAVGGACIAQPAGVRRRCVGEQKCLGGRVAVRGREEAFGGEWVVRSAGLTHIRRSSTRARVLLYIRPACPRREIAAMGSKDAPCEHPSPANDFRTRPVRVCTSAPAFTLPPSAFTLPPHSLPLPPRSNRPPAAAVIHNGLSTEKLSTSLPAALCKTFSPSRLRTRIYNISFARRPLPGSVRAAPEKSPRRCGTVSRAAVRRVGEGEGKGGRPLAQCRTCRLCAESLCAKAECTRQTPPLPVRSPRGNLSTAASPPACVPNHSVQRRKCTRPTPPLPVRSPRDSLSTAAPLPACVPNHCVQRRKCTRPTPPLPVRSPRDSLSTAAPLPVDGRTAVRRVGEGEGKGGRPLAQQPAPVCLPPRPRRLNGHPTSAGGRENDRMAHRRTTTPTHRTQRGNDTCTIRVP